LFQKVGNFYKNGDSFEESPQELDTFSIYDEQEE
jgi:hypothetical protein